MWCVVKRNVTGHIDTLWHKQLCDLAVKRNQRWIVSHIFCKNWSGSGSVNGRCGAFTLLWLKRFCLNLSSIRGLIHDSCASHSCTKQPSLSRFAFSHALHSLSQNDAWLSSTARKGSASGQLFIRLLVGESCVSVSVWVYANTYECLCARARVCLLKRRHWCFESTAMSPKQ